MKAFPFPFLVVAVAACTPAPIPNSPPLPDASDAASSAVVVSDSVAACQSARDLGCAFGSLPTCAPALSRAVAEHHVSAETIACAARHPPTVEALRACGAYFACSR